MRAVAETAKRQHGTVTLEQLLDARFSRWQIARAVNDGALVPIHRGVFALAYLPLTPQSRLFAAAAGIGDDAALSHASAAFVHRLVTWLPPTIDVVAPRKVRPRDGIRVHERRRVDPIVVDGLRVTDVVVTVRDLAATDLPTSRLRRAVRQAQVEHRIPYDAFLEALDGSPGTKRLRAVLGAKAIRTRSEGEDRMEAFFDAHGFSEREHNVMVLGQEADVLFRDIGLIVEVDSRAFHSSQIAQEDDRRKQAIWEAAGLAVVRVTRDQVLRDTARTLARLRYAVDAQTERSLRTGARNVRIVAAD